MSVLFHCSACGGSHLSRIRGRDRRWVEMYLESCGPVLELCPGTREWVRLDFADSSWIPEHTPRGVASPLVSRSPRA